MILPSDSAQPPGKKRPPGNGRARKDRDEESSVDGDSEPFTKDQEASRFSSDDIVEESTESATGQPSQDDGADEEVSPDSSADELESDVIEEDESSSTAPIGQPVAAVDEAVRAEVLECGDDLLRVVEALIFASHDVVHLEYLCHGIPRVDKAKIEAAVKILAERYRNEDRAYELVEIADGYRLMTRPEYFPYLARMRRKREVDKLTPAALETLAIIAYRQPVTRADVEGIRGVQSDSLFRTLLDRKLVRITGRAEVIGRPLLYGTTRKFLDMFGLANLSDLPKPSELGENSEG